MINFYLTTLVDPKTVLPFTGHCSNTLDSRSQPESFSLMRKCIPEKRHKHFRFALQRKVSAQNASGLLHQSSFGVMDFGRPPRDAGLADAKLAIS